MITITPAQLKKIAEENIYGFKTFINKTNSEVLTVPNVQLANVDTTNFLEALNKIALAPNDYFEIAFMNGQEAFKIMESFANSNIIENSQQLRLKNALAGAGAFGNFKRIIEIADFKNDWFKFKLQADMAFVETQVNQFNASL